MLGLRKEKGDYLSAKRKGEKKMNPNITGITSIKKIAFLISIRKSQTPV
jgi:hypothetical protein